jgi:hypothetical protein
MNFNKFIIYILIFLLYLVMSSFINVNEVSTYYIQDEKSLIEILQDDHQSLILTDMKATGFFMKTYFHHYLLVGLQSSAQHIIVRTSPTFYVKNKQNLGMSLLRKYKLHNKVQIETTVHPPTAYFIGNTRLGQWVSYSNNTQWIFYRPYKYLVNALNIQGFILSQDHFFSLQKAKELGENFYGLQNEFGTNGSITQKNYIQFFENNKFNQKISFKELFKDLFRSNFRI